MDELFVDGWMNWSIGGWMGCLMDGWVDEWMDVRIYRKMGCS